MLFPVSILAVREDAIRHCVCIIEAANEDEALGKATKIAEKSYPTKNGFINRHAVLGSMTPSTLDNVRVVE